MLHFQFEEAISSNKRLQAMINIRKPNDKLSTTLKSTMHLNSTEKLTKWLASETEIQKSRAIHREALDQLVAERIRLRQEIISLKVLLLE